MGDSMEEELKIVDKFFRFREEKFMEEITADINSLNKLEKNKISLDRQQINELLNNISEEDIKEQILDQVDNLIVDYNIAIARNNKQYYRQGFIDCMQIR